MPSARPPKATSVRAGASFDPARLAVASFAAEEGELAGEWPMADLPRLAASLAQPAEVDADVPPVRWRAAGGHLRLPGAGRQPMLHLEADASVTLECQRCLEPLHERLRVDRRFVFVEGEETAAALDLDSEEDVLALERSMDLRRLVEDELLLALPLIPRHAACPQTAVSAHPGSAGPLPGTSTLPAGEHPFASLAALKRRNTAS